MLQFIQNIKYYIIIFLFFILQNVSANTDINQQVVSNKSNDISITSVWARPSNNQSKNTAIYLEVSNNTENDIKLIGGSANGISEIFEIHNSFVDQDGISRMVAVDNILIPAQSKVSFAPGGLHIMLLKLNKILNVGDNFDVVLYFDNNHNQKVNVTVKSINKK